MALAACVYLATMGKQGLRTVAELCYHKAHYAARLIAAIPGFSLPYGATPFFNEFVVRCPVAPASLNDTLRRHRIIGGYQLGRDYKQLNDCLLFCVTELNSRHQIDRLAQVLREATEK